MPRDKHIRKVLVIGSGPIVIGQAAEFDYAGTQACRVLRQEGIQIVLVNSNPATIMTDTQLADSLYFEPLDAQTLTRILEKERPDGLLATLGGQTGLTLAMELSRDGTLARLGVRLLGTGIDAINLAENRALFRALLREMELPLIPSDIAADMDAALEIARGIGYPVIVRPAFTLGGTGGGLAEDEAALREIVRNGLALSPISQLLIEKSVAGWKEIEFETVRDCAGNAIAVCSMENVDPVGIHTGDSIVVAPALTLTDREHQTLRAAALEITERLGIVGGCNCQFACRPESFDYAVIEVNPRVSRSSALASKATGYPIAKISTLLALGYTLDALPGEVIGKTSACFEPALDYVAVKLPKWSFEKFPGIRRQLGTQMQSTGEVMALAPGFEMALMKAVRGAELSLDTLNAPPLSHAPVLERLALPDDRRLFTVFEALKSGVEIEQIHALTQIDRWFLRKLENLAAFETELSRSGLSEALYRQGKTYGYPDAALCRLSGADSVPGLSMCYKMVDTCAAEFDVHTPYFYSCCDSACEARSLRRSGKPVVMVLGSGPIRIGQGVEFDYCSVHCVWALRSLGYDVVIVNNNPETVSTDYDTADRLYFEPLTLEDVMNIVRVEQPVGVIVSFGGQTALRLTRGLAENGVPILGTAPDNVDLAEDRGRFYSLLKTLGIARPEGRAVWNPAGALEAGNALGYPVLLRPSYVIGGREMTLSRSAEETRACMQRLAASGAELPVLVDKFLPGRELEVDMLCDGERVLIPGIMEHIERAGVHSGDSIAVYPPYDLSDAAIAQVCSCARALALALGIKGLVNIQFVLYQETLYVLEANPRASRTVPFMSKLSGIPMVALATRLMLGETLADAGYGELLLPAPSFCAVKVPVFSFEKLSGANPVLGPEMKSTGEVMGIGRNLAEALCKGMAAAGCRMEVRRRGMQAGVLFLGEDCGSRDAVRVARAFSQQNMTLYARSRTAAQLAGQGVPVSSIAEGGELHALLDSGTLCCIVFAGTDAEAEQADFLALHRRAMQLPIPFFTSTDTAAAFARVLAGPRTPACTELTELRGCLSGPPRDKRLK